MTEIYESCENVMFGIGEPATHHELKDSVVFLVCIALMLNVTSLPCLLMHLNIPFELAIF